MRNKDHTIYVILGTFQKNGLLVPIYLMYIQCSFFIYFVQGLTFISCVYNRIMLLPKENASKNVEGKENILNSNLVKIYEFHLNFLKSQRYF
jgi:hypothetical protein